jgi:hypothetical protein
MSQDPQLLELARAYAAAALAGLLREMDAMKEQEEHRKKDTKDDRRGVIHDPA